MAWSFDTSPGAGSAVAQQRPDRCRQPVDGERLVQEEPSKTQPHPIVISLLRAVRGHQEDLHLWTEGLHFRRELQSVHQGHHDICKE
jgi:hypothetical protein